MRHRKSGRHFRRTSAHQRAMFSNLVSGLLLHERVRTTDAKAKELRRVAEKAIHWGVQLGELLIRNREQMKPDERARIVHAMRMARRRVRDRVAVQRLFDEIAPRYLGRKTGGGYTRIVKIGQRKGDAAPISLIELIAGETAAAPAAPAAPGPKARAARPKEAPRGIPRRKAKAA
jgi:large subunit ribosomal protein L17